MTIVKAFYAIPSFKERNSSMPSCPRKISFNKKLILDHNEGD